MTFENARRTDIDATAQAAQERPRVVVKFNRSAGTAVCPVCNDTIAVGTGPNMVLEEGGTPVCADHYAPSIDDVVEEYGMLQAARDWYPVSLPPIHAYYETLREAIYRHPTGIYWSDDSSGSSGGHVLEEHKDQLNTPVVRIGRNLYCAEARRIDELQPLFRVADGNDDSLASILTRHASGEDMWLALNGVVWSSRQLLAALTTEQLALSVTWESIGDGRYDGLVLWDRQEQGPVGDPFLIEIPLNRDATDALKLVYGPNALLPVIRPARSADVPSGIGTGVCRWPA